MKFILLLIPSSFLVLDTSTMPTQFQYLEKLGMLGLMGVAIYFLWKEQETLKKSNADLINKIFEVEKKHIESDAKNLQVLEGVREALEELRDAVRGFNIGGKGKQRDA